MEEEQGESARMALEKHREVMFLSVSRPEKEIMGKGTSRFEGSG